MSDLFEETTLGDLVMPNRIVMAPMTRSRATADGMPTDLMAEYYAQRAGAGLIISEGVHPTQVGQGFLNTPGLHTHEQAQRWRSVTDAVHRAGGRIVVQLMHAGRIGHPSLYPSAHRSVAPSAIAAAGRCFTPAGMQPYEIPVALDAVGIERVVDGFVTASVLAIEAGFDGVEIHGGNGFLLHQFLAANTNLRDDAYGGDPERRAALPVAVVAAVADAIGPGRVGLRISPSNPYNDIVEEDLEQTYRPLLTQLPPIAFLHVLEAVTPAPTARIAELWSGPTIVNPRRSAPTGHWDPQAASIVDGDRVRAIVVGAAFLANPDLLDRIRAGGPYNAADESTYYSGGAQGYIDYPSLMAVR